MRMITRMLLASVLAIGAGSFAGCGDMADCPGSITGGDSCSAAGLSCSSGSFYCTCMSGLWACVDDLPPPIVHDMAMHDLAPATD